jgi:hypothetical protein
MKVNFEANYSNTQQREANYDFMASYFDHVILNDWEALIRVMGWEDLTPIVSEYKSRNPAIGVYPYVLNWTVMQDPPMLGDPNPHGSKYYSHMQEWYANHPEYNLEDAFLHDADICPEGTPKTEECRIQLFIWDSNRWVVNPKDPGLQAYQSDRLRQIVFGPNNTYETDGLFFDEYSGFCSHLENFNIREYNLDHWCEAYKNDMINFLNIEHNAIGTDKKIILNTAEYTSEFHLQMITAAGGTHMEMMNNPTYPMSSRWSFMDSVLQNGGFIHLTGVSLPTYTSYNSGNYSTKEERWRISQLASYYMVVPTSPESIGFTTYKLNQDNWMKAIEVNIGKPLGTRQLYQKGTDPNGVGYEILGREFENTWVFIRCGSGGYSTFDDTTAVTISLPPGDEYFLLRDDGSVQGPLSSIILRNAEAAILIKGSKLSEISDNLPPASPTGLKVQ